MYQPIVRLFSCDFRVISIRHLPAALPIKRWLSLLNHVTYAHNSGIRETYVLEICPFHTLFSINGLLFLHICKWRMTGSRVCLMVFPHCLLWWIATFTLLQMENGQWTVYALWPSFTVSFDGLLLLHIYKRRMGCEPYMPYGFPSLSPLTDCYLYTSANEEWACNRVCLMVSFPCLHWWIDTSTLLQMESGSEPYMLHGFSTLSPLMDCYFYTSANGEMDM